MARIGISEDNKLNKSLVFSDSKVCKTVTDGLKSRFNPLTTLGQRNDLVGRRVLCIPKTFTIEAPSPVQLSSSLWSSRTLSALKNSGNSHCTTLNWCPTHHHHQDDQQDFLQLIRNIKENNVVQTENEQVNQPKRARLSRSSGSGGQSKSTYSVLKKLQQTSTISINNSSNNTTTKTTTDCDQAEFNGTPNFCKSCDIGKSSDSDESLKCHLNSLPWRLGTIRAVSHRNLDDEELDVMIEFDLVDWKTRDWYNVRDRLYDDEDSDSVSVLPEASLQNEIKIKKKVSKDSETERKLKQSKESSVIPSDLKEQQEQYEIKVVKSETVISDQQADAKLKPSAFKVLLIESSICCLSRRHSPIGQGKLWPALIFEPFIDELGLFNSTLPTLSAIEYLDPDIDQSDNLIMKSICDIETIVTELELEFSNSTELNRNDYNQKIAIPPPDQQNHQSDRLEDASEEHLRLTTNNMIDSDLRIDLKCDCWSPKVEFIHGGKVHRFCNRNLHESFSATMTSKETVEVATSTLSKHLKRCSSRSQKTIDPTHDDVSSMMSVNSTNLNSFKRFLRFFHNIYTTVSSTSCLGNVLDHKKTVYNDNWNSRVSNDLLQAIIQYPQLYYILRDWHLFQDSQSILGSEYTASLLVSNRVKVYRSSGTTQWFTAVIIAYDERTNLLTLIDDTVLEEHHEDPTLLEIHPIDDGLIQSIIEGDVATSGSSTRRRAQRSNQRQAAQTAQKAIMNLSTLANGVGCQLNSSCSMMMTAKQQGKSSMEHKSPACHSPSPSSSPVTSSQYLTEGSCKMTSSSYSHSDKISSIKQSNAREGTRIKGRRLLGQTSSFLAACDIEISSNKCSDRWTNKLGYKSLDSHVFEEKLGKKEAGVEGSRDRFSNSSHKFFKNAPIKEKSVAPTSPKHSDSLNCVRSSQGREATIEGKNFTSHRLRLEALEKRLIFSSSPYDDLEELELDLDSTCLKESQTHAIDIITTQATTKEMKGQQEHLLIEEKEKEREEAGIEKEELNSASNLLSAERGHQTSSAEESERNESIRRGSFQLNKEELRRQVEATQADLFKVQLRLKEEEEEKQHKKERKKQQQQTSEGHSAESKQKQQQQQRQERGREKEREQEHLSAADAIVDSSQAEQRSQQQQQPKKKKENQNENKKRQKKDNSGLLLEKNLPAQQEHNTQDLSENCAHYFRESQSASAEANYSNTQIVEEEHEKEAKLQAAELEEWPGAFRQQQRQKQKQKQQLRAEPTTTSTAKRKEEKKRPEASALVDGNRSGSISVVPVDSSRGEASREEEKRRRRRRRLSDADDCAGTNNLDHQLETAAKITTTTNTTTTITTTTTTNTTTNCSEEGRRPLFTGLTTGAEAEADAIGQGEKIATASTTATRVDSIASAKAKGQLQCGATVALLGQQPEQPQSKQQRSSTEKKQQRHNNNEQQQQQQQQARVKTDISFSFSSGDSSYDSNNLVNYIEQSKPSAPQTSTETSEFLITYEDKQQYLKSNLQPNIDLKQQQQHKSSTSRRASPTKLENNKNQLLLDERTSCDTEYRLTYKQHHLQDIRKLNPTSVNHCKFKDANFNNVAQTHLNSPKPATPLSIPSSLTAGLITSNNTYIQPAINKPSIQSSPSDIISGTSNHRQTATLPELSHHSAKRASSTLVAPNVSPCEISTVPWTTTLSSQQYKLRQTTSHSSSTISITNAPDNAPTQQTPIILSHHNQELSTANSFTTNPASLPTEGQILLAHSTPPAHSRAMHNFGPNLHEQNKSTLSWPNNLANLQHLHRQQQQQNQQQQQHHQQQHQQQQQNNNSNPNALASSQAQQQYGSYSPQAQAALQSTIASRVDQIIRTTLYDSIHMPKITSNNQINTNNMPSSSSSMICKPNNSPISSSSQGFSASNPMVALMSASSTLAPFYSSAFSNADQLNNSTNPSGSYISEGNSGNYNSNLQKTSAHSASHSALAAAAALQSLNQSHLQRSHQMAQIQQLANPATRLPASNPQSYNNSMPKLGVTSTTSSDHHNHNHLATTTNLADNQDVSARFQQKQILGNKPNINWQDQLNLNGNPKCRSQLNNGPLPPAHPMIHQNFSINSTIHTSSSHLPPPSRVNQSPIPHGGPYQPIHNAHNPLSISRPQRSTSTAIINEHPGISPPSPRQPPAAHQSSSPHLASHSASAVASIHSLNQSHIQRPHQMPQIQHPAARPPASTSHGHNIGTHKFGSAHSKNLDHLNHNNLANSANPADNHDVSSKLLQKLPPTVKPHINWQDQSNLNGNSDSRSQMSNSLTSRLHPTSHQNSSSNLLNHTAPHLPLPPPTRSGFNHSPILYAGPYQPLGHTRPYRPASVAKGLNNESFSVIKPPSPRQPPAAHQSSSPHLASHSVTAATLHSFNQSHLQRSHQLAQIQQPAAKLPASNFQGHNINIPPSGLTSNTNLDHSTHSHTSMNTNLFNNHDVSLKYQQKTSSGSKPPMSWQDQLNLNSISDSKTQMSNGLTPRPVIVHPTGHQNSSSNLVNQTLTSNSSLPPPNRPGISFSPTIHASLNQPNQSPLSVSTSKVSTISISDQVHDSSSSRSDPSSPHQLAVVHQGSSRSAIMSEKIDQKDTKFKLQLTLEPISPPPAHSTNLPHDSACAMEVGNSLPMKTGQTSGEHVITNNLDATANILNETTEKTVTVLDKTSSIDANVVEPTSKPASIEIRPETTKYTKISDSSIPSHPQNSDTQIKPNLYPKLKKAWLINYDQEEDQARLKSSTDDTMAVDGSEKATSDISSVASKEDKPTPAKNKKGKLENKKKIKDTPKKKTSLPPIRNSRATKVVHNDSEVSNASTSDLDSDDTASQKLSGTKRLRQMPRRKVKPNSEEQSSPKLKNISNSVQRKTGKKLKGSDEFLQTESCYEIVQKGIRCLECRRVRVTGIKNDKVPSSKANTKTNWDDFCRFYEFRKLRYNSTGNIVIAGFSDLDDAKECDKRLWLPDTNETQTNISCKVAEYIIANVGDEFCKLVMQERAAHELYAKQRHEDKRINWKRTVSGLRELCDVCSTTLFNCHYVCERCGFVVCIDCFKERASDRVSEVFKRKVKDTISDKSSNSDSKDLSSSENAQSDTPDQAIISSSKKSKKDSYGWIYCTKNEEHSHDNLILTQIIAADCLEEVWTMLHKVRRKLNLGSCVCEGSSNEIKPTINTSKRLKTINYEEQRETVSKDVSQPVSADDCDVNSKSSHSTLKGLLLASNSSSNGTVSLNELSPSNQDDELGYSTGQIPDTKTSTNNSTYTSMNDVEMFNDSSNEDDSQEDTKLSQQVTAAIEGCISSLPDGVSESLDLDKESIFDSKKENVILNGPSSSASLSNLAKKEETKFNFEFETHTWLNNGDLLVLSQAKHKLNIELFRQQWRQGKPVLVRGVDKLMKIDMWLPQFFGKEFGDYRSDLVDCRNGDIHRHSMKKYWEGFEPNGNTTISKKRIKDENMPSQTSVANNEELSNGPSYYSGSALWRLKDWPPGQDFYEILPSHYEDFMDNLPLKEYTTRSGKLNLACRLPKEMLKPDLGPKMYSAYGTSRFPERGTTNLHLDISDAINVMVYVNGATSFNGGSEELRDIYDKTIEECCIDESMKQQIRSKKLVPGALWHIFKPSDARKMREFLDKVSDERNISPDKRNDPIHDQTWYLDQALLDRLYSEYGVKSYAILQCMGDAILIPAGAPHQVKNLQNCIKVANDFVSPENVRFCLQLTDEFRNLPETHMNQEDKLQIKNILYHSIKESLQYLASHKRST